MSDTTHRGHSWPACGASGQADSFVRDHLPPKELWPDLAFYGTKDATSYPRRLNAASVLLDEQVLAGRSGAPALYYDDQCWSYGFLRQQVDRIVRVLVEEMDLVTGNRVLVYGSNCPMTAAAILAVWKAGGVAVPAMAMLRSRELSYMLKKARVHHALVEEELLGELHKAAGASLRVLYFTADGRGDGSLEHVMRHTQSGAAAADTAADDPALIAFTSGTTGKPKGTVHFHRDLVVMCDLFPRHHTGVRGDDVFAGTPPLPFTFGLGGLLCFPLRYGASSVLIKKPTMESLLDAFERHGVSMLYSSPAMYAKLVSAMAEVQLRSVRCCVSAGEHLPSTVASDFLGATGLRIVNGIGTTEMVHIFIAASGPQVPLGATGSVVPGYDVRICDSDGQQVPDGDVGRLAVRGPTGCRYLDDVDRQREYVQRGFNITGDAFRVEDGYFCFVARTDDLIVSRGYNIAGREVEEVLLQHPLVRECAVVGVRVHTQTVVKAYVVLAQAGVTAEDATRVLASYLQEHLARFKCPRAFAFVSSLPRTLTGKVQRYKLRDGEA